MYYYYYYYNYYYYYFFKFTLILNVFPPLLEILFSESETLVC
jgi:hypothetical protein